ncbi:hypothetical protein Goari_023623 [Gossypium aridum]|uniref:DUF4283 domain-containing protein n=1 Tax=Gossypium aridum TaxID=34290 RepID=A0A7J8X419_GOSAI|nr:hypothetical protein [Gossypium aridum]
MENMDSLRKSFKDMLMEKNTLILRLENEFELERDLFRGMMMWSWVMYGHYLIVQPWSKDFLTSDGNLSKVVVWLRLPGLLYKYYTKGFIRAITESFVMDVVVMAIHKQHVLKAKAKKVVVEQHAGFEAYDEGKLIFNTRWMSTRVNLGKIIVETLGEWFRRNLEQDKKKGISMRDITKKDFKVRKRLESIHIANNHVIEWVDSMLRELEAHGMGGPLVGECNEKNENLMEGGGTGIFKWNIGTLEQCGQLEALKSNDVILWIPGRDFNVMLLLDERNSNRRGLGIMHSLFGDFIFNVRRSRLCWFMKGLGVIIGLQHPLPDLIVGPELQDALFVAGSMNENSPFSVSLPEKLCLLKLKCVLMSNRGLTEDIQFLVRFEAYAPFNAYAKLD